ncbi:MAG: lysylphosphatidylglycerol synthase domain-containing protein, partial [Gemmatimonadales bacterium]
MLSALILAGALVLLLTHQDNTRAVAAQLRRLPATSLAAAFAFVLAQIAFQGLRLWAVFPRRFRVGPGRVLHAFTLGEWLNMFVPARSGDAVKIL